MEHIVYHLTYSLAHIHEHIHEHVHVHSHGHGEGGIWDLLLYSVEHAVEDSIGVLPFLLLTYLLMEYIEHKAGSRLGKILTLSGKTGPLWGGFLGVIPQCGMSAAASNFYAGRMITPGTLLAIYLSTSDEMLPIMLSSAVSPSEIGRILALKVMIGALGGFAVDFVYFHLMKKERESIRIHELCEHEHCHCERGIVRSALNHTIRIFLYILLLTILLNLAVEWVGEEALASFILNKPVLGPFLAGIIGLRPNCAASVIITRLYLDGLMSLGTMMAGLLVGAGVGILVLLKVNENKKESLGIIGLLYGIGVFAGILLNLIG